MKGEANCFYENIVIENTRSLIKNWIENSTILSLEKKRC